MCLLCLLSLLSRMSRMSLQSTVYVYKLYSTWPGLHQLSLSDGLDLPRLSLHQVAVTIRLAPNPGRWWLLLACCGKTCRTEGSQVELSCRNGHNHIIVSIVSITVTSVNIIFVVSLDVVLQLSNLLFSCFTGLKRCTGRMLLLLCHCYGCYAGAWHMTCSIVAA